MSMKLLAIALAVVSLACAVEDPPVDPATFGALGTFHLEYSHDGFGMRSHGVIERLDGTPNGRTKLYPLPQSSFEEYAKLRPADLKRNPLAATSSQYERQEVIGPH